MHKQAHGVSFAARRGKLSSMNLILQSFIDFFRAWRGELVCAVVVLLVVPCIAGYIIVLRRRLVSNLPGQLGSPDSARFFVENFKLLLDPSVAPADAHRFIFWLAPVSPLVASFVSLGVFYCGPAFRIARDIDIGFLFVVGVASLAFLGTMLAGWSTRHFTAAAALRGTARLLSCQLVCGLAIVSGVVLSGSLKIRAAVDAQFDQRVWFFFLAPVSFFIYLAAYMFSTNRRLFEVPETESQLAGFSTAYGGFRSTLYLTGEFASMVVAGAISVTLFFGGWLRPFPNVPWLSWLDVLPGLALITLGAGVFRQRGKMASKARMRTAATFVVALVLLSPWVFPTLRFALPGLNAAFWFLLKLIVYVRILIRLRSTLPLFRFDQLMHLSWYILAPLSIVNIFFVAAAMLFASDVGYRWPAAIVGNASTVGAALFLLRLDEQRSVAAYSRTPGTAHSYAR